MFICTVISFPPNACSKYICKRTLPPQKTPLIRYGALNSKGFSAHYCIDLFLQVWFGSNRSLIKRQQSLSAKHRVISKSDLRLSKKTSTRKSTIHFLTSTRKVCLCVRVCIECGVNQSKSICLWICVPACLSVCVCMYMHHVHISYTSSFVLLICF